MTELEKPRSVVTPYGFFLNICREPWNKSLNLRARQPRNQLLNPQQHQLKAKRRNLLIPAVLYANGERCNVFRQQNNNFQIVMKSGGIRQSDALCCTCQVVVPYWVVQGWETQPNCSFWQGLFSFQSLPFSSS